MAFTYSDALLTDRDRVRFATGDTVVYAGPKPADANFSDAEIAGLLAIEGVWQRAVAAAFETLAASWATHVSFDADGMQVSQSDVAAKFTALAQQWRQRYGGASESGCAAVTRVDGYSSDADNVTVEATP